MQFHIAKKTIFVEDTFVSHPGGPNKQFGTHEKLFCGVQVNLNRMPGYKKEGKDQISIQSNTTPDPRYRWKSDNFILDTTNFPSRWPQGINKQAQTKA